MNKLEITNELNKITELVIDFIGKLSPEDANFSANGKWSINGNFEHLILCIKPLTKAHKIPKFILKWKFGKMNRDLRSYEEILDKYNNVLTKKGNSFLNPFAPKNKGNSDKNQLIKEYQLETDKLIRSLENWDENQLDNYVLPHPLLGKLSIREMLYFTHLHTNHHFKTIKKYSSCYHKK